MIVLTYISRSVKEFSGPMAMIIRGIKTELVPCIVSYDSYVYYRQRKALNPPFTTGSIREMAPIFYESGYKAKAAWEDILSKTSAGEAIVNVQKWYAPLAHFVCIVIC